MTFNELMQKYVNTPYEELVGTAKTALVRVFPALEVALGDRETVAKFMLAVIGTCIGADSNLTVIEAKFASDVLAGSLNTEVLLAMRDVFGDEEARVMVDEVVDELDTDTKLALCVFCACLMASDETITRDEAAFVAKLLS